MHSYIMCRWAKSLHRVRDYGNSSYSSCSPTCWKSNLIHIDDTDNWSEILQLLTTGLVYAESQRERAHKGSTLYSWATSHLRGDLHRKRVSKMLYFTRERCRLFVWKCLIDIKELDKTYRIIWCLICFTVRPLRRAQHKFWIKYTQFHVYIGAKWGRIQTD